MAGLLIRRLWDFQGLRLLKVKIFVAWHVSVTTHERDIALVIIISYYFLLFLTKLPYNTIGLHRKLIRDVTEDM